MSAENSSEIPWQNRAYLSPIPSYGISRNPQPIAPQLGETVIDRSVVTRLCPELDEHTPGYVRTNFEYFYASAADVEKRQEFIRRGITPTNNLRKYFDISQPEYWKPEQGIRNPLHRNTHPFGHILERLEFEQPDLWGRAVAAEQAYETAHKQNLATIHRDGHTDEELAAAAMALETATWHNRAVMSEVFDVIAPQMQAEGFDPISACK